MTPHPHPPPGDRAITPWTGHVEQHAIARHSTRGRHRVATVRTPVRPRPVRPTSVWPYGDAESLPGTAAMSGWLARTIITLVTGYTRPGHRVLLLAPPTPPTRTDRTAPGADRSGRDPFAGLHEASWSIARLGRGIQTATAAPPPDYPDEPTDHFGNRSGGSESGPGPDWTRPPAGADPDSRPGPQDDPVGRPGPGFDLIITAVHPHATHWLRDTPWTQILNPQGTLAAITHSDHVGGQAVDSTTPVIATLRAGGLWWCDHIAVLTHPTPGTARPATSVVPPAPARRPRRLGRTALVPPSDRSLPVRQAYQDLLLFLPADPSMVQRDSATGSPGTADHARNRSDD
jgi:hypothetical protein